MGLLVIGGITLLALIAGPVAARMLWQTSNCLERFVIFGLALPASVAFGCLLAVLL